MSDTLDKKVKDFLESVLESISENRKVHESEEDDDYECENDECEVGFHGRITLTKKLAGDIIDLMNRDGSNVGIQMTALSHVMGCMFSSLKMNGKMSDSKIAENMREMFRIAKKISNAQEFEA